MWQTVIKLWKEIKEEEFKNWIKKKRNKILLILFFIIIIDVITMFYLVKNFIDTLINTDMNIVIYLGLAILYAFGCTQPLFDCIAKKNREFKLLLSLNKKEFKKNLKSFEYISISSIIAKTAKNLSTIIIVFMFNLILYMSDISQNEQQYIYSFIYVNISLFVMMGSTLAITNGYFSTDIMTVLNTDGFIRRKRKKSYKKYNLYRKDRLNKK